jgi:hypothetical protein
MRKALLRKVLLLTFPLAVLASGLSGTEAQSSPPAGTCCAVRFAQCAANCDCGVFEFNCTLEFPGCHSNCICNICP